MHYFLRVLSALCMILLVSLVLVANIFMIWRLSHLTPRSACFRDPAAGVYGDVPMETSYGTREVGAKSGPDATLKMWHTVRVCSRLWTLDSGEAIQSPPPNSSPYF